MAAGSGRQLFVQTLDYALIARFLAPLQGNEMNLLACWLAVVAATAVGNVMAAQTSGDLPTRAVRLLVPSPPGGPSDFAGRLIAPGLGEALGQNVVIDARQSVNGILSMETAARASPDGSTLSIGNVGTHVMNVGLYKKLPYDPVRDFVPVGRIISAGTALVSHPKFMPNSFREFIAAAKKDPGKINIAIAGANGHVGTEVLKSMAGINLNNVPYKGSSPSELAVMSGEVEVSLLSIPIITPYVKAGRMKMIATMGEQRVPGYPQYPTVAEVLPGFSVSALLGFVVPSATPRAVVQKIQADTARVLANPETKKRIEELGMEIVASTPKQFSDWIHTEITRWGKVIKDTGAKAE